MKIRQMTAIRKCPETYPDQGNERSWTRPGRVADKRCAAGWAQTDTSNGHGLGLEEGEEDETRGNSRRGGRKTAQTEPTLTAKPGRMLRITLQPVRRSPRDNAGGGRNQRDRHHRSERPKARRKGGAGGNGRRGFCPLEGWDLFHV